MNKMDISNNLGEPDVGSPAEMISREGRMLSVTEVRFLKLLSSHLSDDAIVVNIGAGFGTSSAAFLEMNPNINLWSFDISQKSLDKEVSMLDKYGLPCKPPYFNQVKGDSSIKGRGWSKGSVDLLFIDGDHTEVGAYTDISTWTPFVKVSGLVIIHDYGIGNNGWEAVYRAVNSWIGKYSYYEPIGRERLLIAFRKGKPVWNIKE
jgi:predicted O-methyltransferase YrrM